MTQAIAYRGRLPGVRCDPALPPVADDAIRLDVAAFVGFAERGPVDDPQPVEDPAQYATVFGGDLPLAIDEHGVPVYAALPDAVRSFFANGGRRAYVVRVVGRAATTLPVPGRVVSRRPLDARTAIVGLDLGTLGPQRALVPTTDAGPLVELGAASPGGWAGRITIDADVVDTVLSLRTDASGEVALTATSRRLVDEGDAVLVRRADQWLQLWAPPAGDALAPAGGWQQGDVARLLRADLTVRRAGDGTTIAVEQFAGLRLGRATTSIGVRSRSWLDVLQPAAGGFVRDRSMFLRAPVADALVPRLGPLDAEVQPDPLPREADAGADADTAGIADGSSPIEVGAVLPPPFSRAALHADGLAELDPVALFLDPDLTGHTIDGLRLAMEVLELADVPHARGVHAIALQPDVAIVAVPDLYHRPWHDQFVVDPSADQPPAAEPPADLPPAVGFQHCAPPAPPVVTAPAPAPPVVLRMVVDPPQVYDPAGMIAVAAAVADLCAARGDMVAVLGLPRHAGLADAQHLADVLDARPRAGTDAPSHVGLWHPWGAVLEARSPALSPLRPVPPDGAVCGTISATELTEGVWIEPAGRALAGYLDVDAVDPTTALALFDRGLNVVRRRPAGFVATSAHSLSADRALLQLSVRRLLIWLRKLALREGTRFVFEPDDERFRGMVVALFNRHLEGLRLAGALVAYQVEVEDLATRPTAQEGQVRINLKVAPTSPIEFITVTLLRSGQDIVQIGGR